MVIFSLMPLFESDVVDDTNKMHISSSAVVSVARWLHNLRHLLWFDSDFCSALYECNYACVFVFVCKCWYVGISVRFQLLFYSSDQVIDIAHYSLLVLIDVVRIKCVRIDQFISVTYLCVCHRLGVSIS